MSCANITEIVELYTHYILRFSTMNNAKFAVFQYILFQCNSPPGYITSVGDTTTDVIGSI